MEARGWCDGAVVFAELMARPLCCLKLKSFHFHLWIKPKKFRPERVKVPHKHSESVYVYVSKGVQKLPEKTLYYILLCFSGMFFQGNATPLKFCAAWRLRLKDWSNGLRRAKSISEVQLQSWLFGVREFRDQGAPKRGTAPKLTRKKRCASPRSTAKESQRDLLKDTRYCMYSPNSVKFICHLNWIMIVYWNLQPLRGTGAG